MIVAGFGFRRIANQESLEQALARTGWAADIEALAAVADRVQRLAGLAGQMRLVLISVPSEELIGAPSESMSAASLRERGTGSVSEAAALLAAGQNAKLLVRRQISDDRLAACAIAQGER